MKIFVTGGNSFLGKHWIENLSKNHEIVAPSRIDCNLTNLNNLFRYTDKYDLILHLAAHTQAGDWCLTHPGEQWLVNQQINTNILRWWFENQPQAKLVSIGTSCSYDSKLEMIESNYLLGSPDSGLFTYAMTKRMLYQGMIAINQQYKLNYLHLIPATLYGSHYKSEGKQKHFIFDLIDKITTAKKLGTTVELWGDGTQERELVFVEDFILNSNYLIEKCENDSFNVGANNDLSIKDYARIICEIVGYDFSLIKYNTDKYTGVKKKLLNSSKANFSIPGYRVSDLNFELKEIIRNFR